MTKQEQPTAPAKKRPSDKAEDGKSTAAKAVTADEEVRERLRAAFPKLTEIPDAILRAARRRDFAAGDVICRPDTALPGLMLVLEGQLDLTKDGYFIRSFKRGDYFGEGALFQDVPPGVTIVAPQTTRLVEFARDRLNPILEAEPSFALSFVRTLLIETMSRLQATNALFSENRTLAERLADTVDQLNLEVAERKRSEQQARYLATYDTLTGIRNRAMFQEHLDLAIRRGERHGARFSVLILDLDKFKEVNDVYGHEVGDKVLIEVAQRLSKTLRDVDSLARLGGDEFAIIQDASHIFQQDHHAGDSATLGTRLLTLMETPIEFDGLRFELSCSIGIALYPDDGIQPPALIRNADLTMYRAKGEGRGRLCLFKPEITETAIQVNRTKAELRDAVARDEMAAVYQPKIDLKTGEVVGMEALLRWRHPERGTVSPAEFIPLAEQNNAILSLGSWILNTACRDTVRWRAEGFQDLRVSVNLSPVQLLHRDVIAEVERALATSGLPAAALELEITEGVFLKEPELVLDKLEKLRAMGVVLSLDDFGTGYSSLSYLSRFPIGVTKIDRSFVINCHQDRRARRIIGAIIDLSHNLDMPVVAEGVDRWEQVDVLRQLRCDVAQGYLIAQPLDAKAFDRFLRGQTEARMRPILTSFTAHTDHAAPAELKAG